MENFVVRVVWEIISIVIGIVIIAIGIVIFNTIGGPTAGIIPESGKRAATYKDDKSRTRCKSDGKLVFWKWSGAERASSNASARGKYLRPYHDNCGYSHLTSQPPRRRS